MKNRHQKHEWISLSKPTKLSIINRRCCFFKESNYWSFDEVGERSVGCWGIVQITLKMKLWIFKAVVAIQSRNNGINNHKKMTSVVKFRRCKECYEENEFEELSGIATRIHACCCKLVRYMFNWNWTWLFMRINKGFNYQLNIKYKAKFRTLSTTHYRYIPCI